MSTLSNLITRTAFTDALRIRIEDAATSLSGTIAHPTEGERAAAVSRFTLDDEIRVDLREEGDFECEVTFEAHGTADLSYVEQDGGLYEVAITTPCSGVASVSLPPRETIPLDDPELVEKLVISVTLDEILLDEEVPLDAGVE